MLKFNCKVNAFFVKLDFVYVYYIFNKIYSPSPLQNHTNQHKLFIYASSVL